MGDDRETDRKGARLCIEVRDGVIPADWDELVSADPAADSCHGSAWWSACAGASRRARPLAITARWRGRLVGGIAAVEERIGPIRRIFALPFGTGGGPLIACGAPGGWEHATGTAGGETWPAASDLAWQRGTPLGGRLALALFQIPSVAEVHLVDSTAAAGEDLAFVPGVECRFPSRGVVDLKRGKERLRGDMAPECRSRIDKASRRGLAVRAPHSAQEQRQALLGLRNSIGPEDEDRPEIARRMIDLLLAWPTSGAGDGIEVRLAEIDGISTVAATVNLVRGDRMQNIIVLSSAMGRTLGADALLHWTAMEKGVDEGRSMYDLGATENAISESLKTSLGASVMRMRSWHRLAPLWRWVRGRR